MMLSFLLCAALSATCPDFPEPELAPVTAHPRLFATAAEFDALKTRLASSELGRQLQSRLEYEADVFASAAPVTRQMVGRRLLMVSQTALSRIGKLALAWRLTGKRAYADAAIREARAVCGFSDWNPGHFLDTAELTLAVALARDWLDETLTPEDKRLFSQAILYKGLTKGDGKTLSDGFWIKVIDNWNQVCNGGLAAGAAAIREDAPDVAEAILRRSARLIRNALTSYRAGGFPEGPSGYWEYATDYQVVALDVLERQFKDVSAYFKWPGLAEQADYMDYMTGPTGLLFNFSDAGTSVYSRRRLIMANSYLALKFNRPDALVTHEQGYLRDYAVDRGPVSTNQIKGSQQRLFPLTLLWYRETEAGVTAHAPLCRALGGLNPVAVLRSGFGADDWYVGVKAGSPSCNHAHLDVGSFVLDALGVRWAVDLGCEDYTRTETFPSIDLWNQGQDSTRWTLFRYSAEGHNTIVLDGARQRVGSCATVDVSSSVPPSVATVDMSKTYPGVRKVVRTFALQSGGGLRLTDCLEGARPGAQVAWGLVTGAHAEIDGSTVVLSATNAVGKLRRLKLKAPVDTRWNCTDLSTPRGVADSPILGHVRLSFTRTVPEDGALTFAVDFSELTK